MLGFGSIFAADGDILFKDFNYDSKVDARFVQVAENKKSFTFDTAKATNPWTPIFTFNAGLLKPKCEYTISFNAEVSGDGFVHFFGYNPTNRIPSAYAFAENATVNTGRTSKIKVSFIAPENADVFEIAFHTYQKVNGKISDFKIEEGLNCKAIPIAKNKRPFKVERSTLPTGAKEFDVDQPNNPQGEVVEAKRFGIVPNTPLNVKLVNDAIDYCRKNKASKLIFEKNATYHFGDGTMNVVHLQDFIFDGNGSTFIFLKKAGTSFNVRNNLRVRVENLNVDWDWAKDPLASIVKIKNIGNRGKGEDFYIDYEFIHYKKHPKYNQYCRAAVLSCWDMKEESVGIERGNTLYYHFILGKHKKTKQEWVSENVLRMYGSHDSPNVKVGQYYRMQHYYYDINHMYVAHNNHLTLRNYTVWSHAGHSFVIIGDKYVHFDKVRIIRRENMPERCISVTADHLHVAMSRGFIKLENCDFSQGADDCINFHDISSYGTKNASNSLISRHNYAEDGNDIEFRKSNYAPTGLIAKRTGSKRLPDGRWEIFFDKELPTTKDNQFIIFNKTVDTHNIIVRNCYFHHNRARGILVLARDVTIENCTFKRNEMGAIKLETGYTTNIWCEGYGVNNVVIRNNTFDTCNPLGVQTMGYERDIFIGTYLRHDPSKEQTTYPILKNILFENNTFKDTFGMVATIGSAGNITFLNNTFINETERQFPLAYRGGFYITHSSNVKIINNKFVESKNTPNIEVKYEKDSTKNLVVRGNKIIKK